MNKYIEDVFKNLQGGQKELGYIRKYIDSLERENKLLADEYKMKCEEIERLKKENLGLNTTVQNQKAKLDKYFKNLVK